MSFEKFIEWLKKYLGQFFGGHGRGRKHARSLEF
jgi:hypothetical protein